jgi:hypothetical protein
MVNIVIIIVIVIYVTLGLFALIFKEPCPRESGEPDKKDFSFIFRLPNDIGNNVTKVYLFKDVIH